MPQSLAQILVHLVFSTKDREPWLAPALRRPRLCHHQEPNSGRTSKTAKFAASIGAQPSPSIAQRGPAVSRILMPMQESLVNALRFRSPHIRERWAALLHVEPVTTPLANPDALVHLIDWTLNDIFQSLLSQSSRRRLTRRLATTAQGRQCCGRNPLLAYFSAGQQAMREALILAQSATPTLDPVERDASLEELNLVLDHIARREIDAFCGVCQHRAEAAGATSLCGVDPSAVALSQTGT